MLKALWGKSPQPTPVEAPTPTEGVKLTPGEKLVLLGVKVHPDTKKRLCELASVAGVPVSAYVRSVLENATR
jgi:hypothetical protein